MEGFDAKAVDEILGLKEKGLRSCVLVTEMQKKIGLRTSKRLEKAEKI
jgi:hypothetical protein